MRGIYSYIPATSHVSRVHSVAAILQFQSMLPVMLFSILTVLYFYFGTFPSMFAVSSRLCFVVP